MAAQSAPFMADCDLGQQQTDFVNDFTLTRTTTTTTTTTSAPSGHNGHNLPSDEVGSMGGGSMMAGQVNGQNIPGQASYHSNDPSIMIDDFGQESLDHLAFYLGQLYDGDENGDYDHDDDDYGGDDNNNRDSPSHTVDSQTLIPIALVRDRSATQFRTSMPNTWSNSDDHDINPTNPTKYLSLDHTTITKLITELFNGDWSNIKSYYDGEDDVASSPFNLKLTILFFFCFLFLIVAVILITGPIVLSMLTANPNYPRYHQYYHPDTFTYPINTTKINPFMWHLFTVDVHYRDNNSANRLEMAAETNDNHGDHSEDSHPGHSEDSHPGNPTYTITTSHISILPHFTTLFQSAPHWDEMTNNNRGGLHQPPSTSTTANIHNSNHPPPIPFYPTSTFIPVIGDFGSAALARGYSYSSLHATPDDPTQSMTLDDHNLYKACESNLKDVQCHVAQTLAHFLDFSRSQQQEQKRQHKQEQQQEQKQQQEHEQRQQQPQQHSEQQPPIPIKSQPHPTPIISVGDNIYEEGFRTWYREEPSLHPTTTTPTPTTFNSVLIDMFHNFYSPVTGLPGPKTPPTHWFLSLGNHDYRTTTLPYYSNITVPNKHVTMPFPYYGIGIDLFQSGNMNRDDDSEHGNDDNQSQQTFPRSILNNGDPTSPRLPFLLLDTNSLLCADTISTIISPVQMSDPDKTHYEAIECRRLQPTLSESALFQFLFIAQVVGETSLSSSHPQFLYAHHHFWIPLSFHHHIKRQYRMGLISNPSHITNLAPLLGSLRVFASRHFGLLSTIIEQLHHIPSRDGSRADVNHHDHHHYHHHSLSQTMISLFHRDQPDLDNNTAQDHLDHILGLVDIDNNHGDCALGARDASIDNRCRFGQIGENLHDYDSPHLGNHLPPQLVAFVHSFQQHDGTPSGFNLNNFNLTTTNNTNLLAFESLLNIFIFTAPTPNDAINYLATVAIPHLQGLDSDNNGNQYQDQISLYERLHTTLTTFTQTIISKYLGSGTVPTTSQHITWQQFYTALVLEAQVVIATSSTSTSTTPTSTPTPPIFPPHRPNSLHNIHWLPPRISFLLRLYARNAQISWFSNTVTQIEDSLSPQPPSEPPSQQPPSSPSSPPSSSSDSSSSPTLSPPSMVPHHLFVVGHHPLISISRHQSNLSLLPMLSPLFSTSSSSSTPLPPSRTTKPHHKSKLTTTYLCGHDHFLATYHLPQSVQDWADDTNSQVSPSSSTDAQPQLVQLLTGGGGHYPNKLPSNQSLINLYKAQSIDEIIQYDSDITITTAHPNGGAVIPVTKPRRRHGSHELVDVDGGGDFGGGIALNYLDKSQVLPPHLILPSTPPPKSLFQLANKNNVDKGIDSDGDDDHRDGFVDLKPSQPPLPSTHTFYLDPEYLNDVYSDFLLTGIPHWDRLGIVHPSSNPSTTTPPPHQKQRSQRTHAPFPQSQLDMLAPASGFVVIQIWPDVTDNDAKIITQSHRLHDHSRSNLDSVQTRMQPSISAHFISGQDGNVLYTLWLN